MKNVTRYEYCRTIGWKVRVKGHPQKLFSDRLYGGKLGSYKAAASYCCSLPPACRCRPRIDPAPTKRNKSGRIGVSAIRYRSAETVYGWRVHWCEPVGVRRSVTFLVSKYKTIEAARLVAVKYREIVECRLLSERATEPIIQPPIVSATHHQKDAKCTQ